MFNTQWFFIISAVKMDFFSVQKHFCTYHAVIARSALLILQSKECGNAKNMISYCKMIKN